MTIPPHAEGPPADLNVDILNIVKVHIKIQIQNIKKYLPTPGKLP
jgi:hypothetical protein